MKITSFDDLYPLRATVGGALAAYSSGSNDAASDVSGAGDVVGDPSDFSVVGLRNMVSLASNIGGGVVGDVLTIIRTGPSVAAFATPSNTGGALDGLSDVNAPSPSDNDVLAWDDGTSMWVPVAPGGGSGDASGQFIVGFDGGLSNLVAGKEQDVVAPYTGTITGWTILADATGSAAFGIGTDTYAGFPTFTSIVASAAPTLSSAAKAQSSTLTGWTTAVTAGDLLRFTLSSVSGLRRVLLVLDYTRP